MLQYTYHFFRTREEANHHRRDKGGEVITCAKDKQEFTFYLAQSGNDADFAKKYPFVVVTEKRI